MPKNPVTLFLMNVYKRTRDDIFNVSATREDIPFITPERLQKNFDAFASRLDQLIQSEPLCEYYEVINRELKVFDSEYSPVWLLSTGRSGSLALNNFLQKSDNILSLHRNISMKDYLMLSYQFLYTISTGTFLMEKPSYLQRLISNYLSVVTLDLLRAKHKGKQLGFINNGHTFFAPIIAKIFPDSKFIFLRRDPELVFQSFLLKHTKAQMEPLAIDPFRLKELYFNNFSYCHFCQTRPTDISNSEKIAWYIFVVNLYCSEFLKTIPSNRYIEIESEDLFSNEKESYQEIQKIFNISDLSYKLFSEHYSKPTNKKSELKRNITEEELNREIQIFHAACERFKRTGRV